MPRPWLAVALATACFVLSFLGSEAQLHHSSPACSRERSRHARAVLDEFFHPVVEKNSFDLPPTCPFGKANDMYLEHELHKEVVRRTQFKSLYSDKVFKNEFFVDKHMDNRHSDKIPKNADTCLADYCDVLRCDTHRRWRHLDDTKARLERIVEYVGIHRHTCDENTLTGIRHHCEAIINRCFPTAMESFENADDDEENNSFHEKSNRLRLYFQKHHCHFLTCDKVEHVFHVMHGHRPNTDGVSTRKIMVGIVGTALFMYYAAVVISLPKTKVGEDFSRRRKSFRNTFIAYSRRFLKGKAKRKKQM